MKKTNNIFIVCFVALIGISIAFVSRAQENKNLQTTGGFAHYKFGSVEALITASGSQYKPGETMHLNAVITNNNDYPIVDGSVYVKIFREQKDQFREGKDYFKEIPDKEIMRNGDFLIDQFMALEGIALKAGETKTIFFDWDVPENILSGQYKTVSYFQSAKKFDLLGLTFTDDVIGNFYSFTVSGDQDKRIAEFDRNNVKLNDKPHDFVSFLKLYDEEEEVKIEAPLINNTNSPQSVTVNWDTYFWDGLLEKNKIKTDKETITLNPKEVKVLSYVIPGNKYPVNYVVAKADWLDSHSILNIRFARSTQEKPRTNFLGISSFPVQANRPVTVFTTAHTVKSMPYFIDINKEGKAEQRYQISLAVKDKNQQVIETYSYAGEVSGQIMGLEAQFLPKQGYDYLILETTIRDSNNVVIDQGLLVYDCQTLDPNQCMPVSSGKDKNDILKLIGLPLAVILLVVVIAFLVKRRKLRGKMPSTLLLMLCLGAGFHFQIFSAQAATTKQTIISNFLGTRAYIQCGVVGCMCEAGWTAIQDLDSKVTYDASSSANEGTPLSVGQTFEVTDTTHNNPYAIYWYTQGYWYASPYGCWNSNLNWSDSYKGSACEYEIYDLVGDNSTCKSSGYACKRLTGTLLFKPPVLGVSTTGPVSCVPKDSYTWSCTVTGGGNIGVTMNYAQTTGKFHYRFYVHKGSKLLGKEMIGEFQKKLLCNSGGCQITANNVCSNITYVENGGDLLYSPINCTEQPWETTGCEDPSMTLPQKSFTWNYTASGGVNNETIVIRAQNGGTNINGYNNSDIFSVGATSNSFVFNNGLYSSTANYVNSGSSTVSYTAPLTIFSDGKTHYLISFNPHTCTLSDGGSCTLTATYVNNNAQCGTITAPDSVVAGQTFSATVMMRNTGSKTWTSDSTPHRLGSANPRDNGIWGTGRVNLSSNTSPNANATFSFTATAPSSTGNQNFYWQMVEDGLEWFGPECGKQINVTPPVSNCALNVTKGGTGSGTITSNPIGINCGGDCSENYAQGTSVTLEASPDANSTFDGSSGWSGCTVNPINQNQCSVTMSPPCPKTVTATFNAVPPSCPTVVLSANPLAVNPGGSTTLSWNITNNPDYCWSWNDGGGIYSEDSQWRGSYLPPGEITNGTHTRTLTGLNPEGIHTYRIECGKTGCSPASQSSASVTVNSVPEYTCSNGICSGEQCDTTAAWRCYLDGQPTALQQDCVANGVNVNGTDCIDVYCGDCPVSGNWREVKP